MKLLGGVHTRWDSRFVRKDFGRDGHTDPGEAAALAHLEPVLDGARVLDLGVGKGRTTTLIAPRAASYIGLDISPGMIDGARERHPGADLRVGDARRLDGIADASVDVVVFSFNGIDAVSHEDRAKVMAEIARVLVPGGRALISSLNLRGPAFGETPATARSTTHPLRERSRNPRRYAGAAYHRAQAELYFRRNVGRAREGDGWAAWPMAAHDFRFVVHFTDLGPFVRSLAEHGLRAERGWASEGGELDLAAERTDADFMHVVSVRD
ncbi:MAG: class I SAM-dependent methyltransferase [Solirubrobacteraceae bacterium]